MYEICRPFLLSRTRSAIPEVALDMVVALVLPEDAVVEIDGRRLLRLESVYVFVRGRSMTARVVLSESTLSDDEM